MAKPTIISKHRVEGLSDGVFAIIITLLVLEIKLPHLHNPGSTTELAAYLWQMWPVFLSWVISFLLVCVTWVHHHRLLDHITRIDVPLFFLNAVLLLTISFIPFPAGLLGEYPDNPLAVSVPGFVLAVCGLSFAAIRFYAISRCLLNARTNVAQFKAISRQQLFVGPVLYTVAALAAWVSPLISIALYLGIPIFFMVAPMEALGEEE